MKNRSIYLVLVFTLIASLAACNAHSTHTAQSVAPTITPKPATPTPDGFGERFERGRITSKALAGNLIGNPIMRDFWVYLPPGYYETEKRYPVIYVLPWWGGKTPGFYERLVPIMDPLIENGEISDMILVFPDASSNNIGSLYMSSPVIGDFETYITKELVEKIDSTYRTIPNRNSRGVMGCSMGGLGAFHLALKFPEVYGVAVPMNGLQMYDPEFDAIWNTGLADFKREPKDWLDLFSMKVAYQMAIAAIAAPNPDKPPFYFDMPYKIINGKAEIDQAVYEKAKKLYLSNDIKSYLDQPVRLNNLLVYTSNEFGETGYKEIISDCDKFLSDVGVQHDLVIFNGGHCNYDFTPVIKYLNEHLVFESEE
jgi:pimeloyl-ACP methyl ester carboxylesterase